MASHFVHRSYDPAGTDRQIQRKRRVHVHVPCGHPAGCHHGRGGAVLGQAVALWHEAGQSHFQAQRVEPVVQGGSGHDPGAHHQPAGRLDGSSLLQLHHGCRDAHSVWRAVLCCGEPPRRAAREPAGADHLPRCHHHRPVAVSGHHSGHLPLRCHHCGRPAAGPVPRCVAEFTFYLPSRSWRAHPCSRWSSSLSAVL